VSGSHRWLLRCYPPAWRARYGEELQELIAQASDGRRMAWRMRLDIVLAGGRERFRASGLTGDSVPPVERSRAGTLLVLCAWVTLVVAGLGVQKISEHWQDVTPASRQGLPAGAFDALIGVAVAGAVLVLAGVACAVPSLLRYLLGGGWREIRTVVVRAMLMTVLAVVVTAALAAWAHRLSGAQRNGHDLAYSLGFAGWALLMLASAAAWTIAGISAARRIELSARLLRCQAWLAAALTATMAGVTVATAVWWVALQDAAPWFFSGRPVGSGSSALPPQLVAALLLMSVATSLGVAGVLRAVRSLPAAKQQLESRRSA
jgi:hypothetical protein